MVSCGEPSGDLYAAALTSALKLLKPDTEVFGLGGPRLAAAGASLVGNYEGLTVTGLVEALAVLPRSYRMLRRLVASARERRPDVFVAIDFPDFNFRLLPAMRKLGVPIVYYISPQLWAWRSSRVATIRRYVDRMLVIFPFEAAIYEKAGVPVEFVGHPLIDLIPKAMPRAEVLRSAGLDPDAPVVALLPGSRPNELDHILPTLAEAALAIRRAVPRVQFLIARAPGLSDAHFAALDVLRRASMPFGIVEHATDDVLEAADVVVTASGTATVQTAMHERPMVIVYRVSPLTYAIGKRFVQVSMYGMVNLIAGRRVVPELIQQDFTAARVAAETTSLLTDKRRAESMRADLREVKSKLGGSGATERAAQAVLAAAHRRVRLA
jgi:lipid-A-disaccharide synthase